MWQDSHFANILGSSIGLFCQNCAVLNFKHFLGNRFTFVGLETTKQTWHEGCPYDLEFKSLRVRDLYAFLFVDVKSHVCIVIL